MTKVLPCACRSEYQDKRYGIQKRLHNLMKKGWRCTVCAHEKADL